MSALTGRHIMLDIETMGTGVGSVIAQIGAVEWWPAEPTRKAGAVFNAHIHMRVSAALGFSFDPDTIMFWMEQSEEARCRFLVGQRGDSMSPGEAIEGLRSYCHAGNGRQGMDARREPAAGVWAHGACFDPVLIEAYCSRLGIATPWDYRTPRDTRTLFALVGKSMQELYNHTGGASHDAVLDCHDQIEACHRALALLRREK